MQSAIISCLFYSQSRLACVHLGGMEVDMLLNESADKEEAVVVTFFDVDRHVVTILTNCFREGRSDKSFVKLIRSCIGNEAWWKRDILATSVKEIGAIVRFSAVDASEIFGKCVMCKFHRLCGNERSKCCH